MKKEDYKKLFQNLNPDSDMENRLAKKIVSYNRNNCFYGDKNVRISICIATAFTFVCILAVQLNLFSNKDVAIVEKNIFSIIAYANSEKVDINTIDAVLLPKARIEKTEDAYGIKGKGGLGFGVVGDNIDKVTYESKNGEFYYINHKLRDEMERQGAFYVTRLFLGKDIINPQGDLQKQFSQLWESGQLDEYKEKYFKGLSSNLDNYKLSIWPMSPAKRISGKQDNDQKYYNYRFGNQVEVPSEYVFVEIKTEEQEKAHGICSKSGKSITLDYYDKYYHGLIWNNTVAGDILKEQKKVDYASLPEDIITIRVNFLDGEVQIRNITVEYDEEGYIIAKLTEEKK